MSPSPKSTTDAAPTAPVLPLNLVIVGLGASAGGLVALQSFFDAVPEDCPLTFVVVSHAGPDQPSLLPRLLQRRSPLPVSEIVDGETPQAYHVYLPPSWSQVQLKDGTFQLKAFSDVRARARRIDVFLASLAQEMQSRCAGVVLSGGGRDGMLGIELIAANGGLTLAQTPATAEQSSMPACAIATGRVQHVLAVHEMPAVIMQHFHALGPQQCTPSAEAL